MKPDLPAFYPSAAGGAGRSPGQQPLHPSSAAPRPSAPAVPLSQSVPGPGVNPGAASPVMTGPPVESPAPNPGAVPGADNLTTQLPVIPPAAESAKPAEPVGVRPDGTALLRSLLEQATALVGAQHGMAFTVDPRRQMVVCKAVHHLPPQHVDTLYFKLGQGNTGRAAATGHPVRLHDSAGVSASGDGSPRRNSVLIVPVTVDGRVIAVLNLNGSSLRDGFSSADEKSVLRLTDEAGPGLYRSLNAENQFSAPRGVSLAELVPPALLKEIQEHCSRLAGVPCVFVDTHGRCLAPITGAADLCILMRSRPASAQRCEASMTEVCSQAAQNGVATYCSCHAGVLTSAAPVIAGTTCVGALVAMLRYEHRDSAMVRAMAVELGLDSYDVLARASAFPSAPREQEPAIRQFTEIVARMTGLIASERLQLQGQEQRYEQMARETAALRELTRQLTGVLDLDAILGEVIHRAIAISGAVAADLSLLSTDRRLQIRAHGGLGSEALDLLSASAADSPGARAVVSGMPCVVESTAAEKRFAAWALAVRRQPGLRSAVSLRVGLEGRPAGALTLYFDRPGRPTDETMQLLHSVVDHAALAIQSVQATEQAQAKEQGLRLFLSRMTRGLSSSIDTSQLIQWVADFASDMIGAPHCVVYELLGADLKVRATSKTGRVVIEKQSLEVGEGLSGAVAASHEQLLIPDLRRDARFVTTAASLPLDAISYVGAPLLYKGELVGVLAIYGPVRTYIEEDMQLLGSFAGQAAVAIQNARSYEHQAQIATTMQQSFLPRERVRMAGLEAGQLFIPASEEVGGDYYDYIPINSAQVAVVLGDVSGKGIRAATYTAMGKYVLRAYAYEDPSPDEVLRRMNALMADQVDTGTYITLFYGLFDMEAGQLRYANGGHPDGLLYRPRSDEFLHLESTGMMIGGIPGESFEARTVPLEPDDLLVLYTDGVIEARRGDELFGVPRLEAAIRQHAALSPNDVARGIYDVVKQFQTGAASDDTCILAFRFRGSRQSGS